MIVPVHNHSEFSALDGYSTVVEIADRIQELGSPGCGLTDHGVLTGLLPFHQEMTSRGLIPILGMEAYQALNRKVNTDAEGKKFKKGQDSKHLILLARTTEGYMNLLRLSDEANRTGFYYDPRVDWELLEKYKEGLIATSACMGSLISQSIMKHDDFEPLYQFHRMFGRNFAIEIHTYDDPEQRDLNMKLMAICEERGITPIIANDAHYARPDQYQYQELINAIGEGRSLDLGNPRHPQCLYIMGEDEVKERLSYMPRPFVNTAIENTVLLMESCRDVKVPEAERHLPVYFRKGITDNDSFLKDLVINGLIAKGLSDNSIYLDRAKMELDVILGAGLGDYFLIVWDFIEWARSKGIIVGPGRGSAGGSLVAYCLNITTIDPIRYGLYFERFYNAGREKGLPDIDVDFPWAKRGLVKEYLAEKWGHDRVLSIGNHIRLRPKLAVERSAMAMGIDYNDALAINKIIDQTTDAGKLADWDTIWEMVGDSLRKYEQRYPSLFENARQLTDRLSTYGVHASAVVISDVDLPGLLPIRRAVDKETKQEVFVTAHEMHSIEAQGFPKFDVLGIKTLDILDKCAELAGYPNFTYDTINWDELEDEDFWSIPERGITLGLFQIGDGHGARQIAADLKPRTVDDLGAIVALNRPGPLRSKATSRYLKRRATGESWKVQPLLEPILHDTYGEFIYQEQVIAICVALGYTLQEADTVRSIMGKKKREAMDAAKEKFIPAAHQHMSPAVAEDLWGQLEGFAAYGFNRSHSIAYGTVLAWTMYAKWRWPQEFIMASIIVRPKERGDYISEARRMGFDVKAPDVNKSHVTIAKVDNDLYMGLSEVKFVGKEAAKWVIQNRPYTSVEQLRELHAGQQKAWQDDKRPSSIKGRSPSQQCSTRAIQMLVDAGAFDSVQPRDITPTEQAELEETLLGVRIIDIYTPIIDKHKGAIDKLFGYTDVDTDGDPVKVPGIITKVRTTKIRADAYKNAGEEMAHVTIEWDGKEMRLAVFPDNWRGNKAWLAEGRVGIFTVKGAAKGAQMLKGLMLE